MAQYANHPSKGNEPNVMPAPFDFHAAQVEGTFVDFHMKDLKDFMQASCIQDRHYSAQVHSHAMLVYEYIDHQQYYVFDRRDRSMRRGLSFLCIST